MISYIYMYSQMFLYFNYTQICNLFDRSLNVQHNAAVLSWLPILSNQILLVYQWLLYHCQIRRCLELELLL